MGTQLQVGTWRMEVTPPLKIPYLGYIPRHALFQDVHDPLHARSMVVSDGERQVAILTVDAIGFHHGILGPGQHFRDKLGAAVADRTGIASHQLMLAASHAHSTPETLDIRPLYQVPGALEWLDRLIVQLADVVATAQSRLQPARLKFGTVQVSGIATNRRQLLANGCLYQPSRGAPPAPLVRPGLVDEAAGVLLAEYEDGSCAVLTNYTCHAVSVQAQPLVSADYPGVTCALVESAAPGCRHCLFTQGADGDINPLRGGQHADFGDVERYGQILGGAVLQQIARLRAPETPSMPPVLDAAWTQAALPIRDLPDPEPYRQTLAEAEAAAERATDNEERTAHLQRARTAREALRAIEPGTDPFTVPVQVLRLGDVALVGCPGELFVALGLEIKQQAAAPAALIVGYANDYAGYLSTPTAFVEGGYETNLGPWCRIAPAGGRMVVDAALELVNGLWCGHRR